MPDDPAATDLEGALRRLYAAMLAHDIPALDRLLAEDAVYIHSTGVVEGKRAYLDGVRDGLYVYERAHPVTEQIARDGNLAVVQTLLDFQGGPRGVAHPPVKLITTLAWRRQDGVWRMIIRHATRVP